jgi:hypothetical protein
LQEQKNEAGLALNAAQQIIIDAKKPSKLTGATAIVDHNLYELFFNSADDNSHDSVGS